MEDKDKKKKKKDDKDESKSYDTTTTININETYDDDDEITLKDELPEPESVEEISEPEEESSVTAKLEKRNTESEISLVTRHLKQIEKNIYENQTEFGILSKIKYFGKLCWLVFLRQLEKIINAIKKLQINNRTIIIALAIIGGLIVAAVLVLTVKRITKTLQTETKKGLQRQKPLKLAKVTNLRLSPLEFHAITGDKIDPKNIKPGSNFYLNFYVMDWSAGKNEKLSLSTDARAYSGSGKLELFAPGYIDYVGKVDKEKDKMLVRTRVDLAKDIPPGFYRLVMSVTELGTQRRSSIRARFKVVP